MKSFVLELDLEEAADALLQISKKYPRMTISKSFTDPRAGQYLESQATQQMQGKLWQAIEHLVTKHGYDA